MRILLILLVGAGSLLAQAKDNNDSRFSTYYLQKRSLFELLPNDPDEIIFLGNSITDGCEWGELFRDPRIKNRGISGDVTEGVLARLGEVTESGPLQIFLMIGVNDLAGGKSIDSLMVNYRKIVDSIRRETPETQLYLQSVLPVNPAFTRFKNHVDKNDSIRILNQRIESLAAEYDLIYINLHHSFLTDDGQMDPAYSNDGLHLTGAGYLRWKKVIESYIPKGDD